MPTCQDTNGNLPAVRISKDTLELACQLDRDEEAKDMLRELFSFRELARKMAEAYISFRLQHGHNPSIEYNYRKFNKPKKPA